MELHHFLFHRPTKMLVYSTDNHAIAKKIGYWTPIYVLGNRYSWVYEICAQNSWTKSVHAEHSGMLCRNVMSNFRYKNRIHHFDTLFHLNVSRYKADSSTLFEVLIQTEYIYFWIRSIYWWNTDTIYIEFIKSYYNLLNIRFLITVQS